MRALFLLLLLSLCCPSLACQNFIAKSEVADALALKPGVGSKKCGGDDPCICFDGIDWRTAAWEQVDDLSKPKYLKAQEQTCAEPEAPAEGEEATPKCQPELKALTCEQGEALIAADRSEVYCAVPNGYEQKNGDKLVTDPDKVAAVESAQAAEAQRQALIAEGLKRQAVGKRLIALITANNDSKGLTADQTATLTTELQPIIQLLQVGAIESAKAKVQALTPDGTLITQADIDLGLSAFTAEGY